MFGNREYVEQHQDSIMAIIRSVGVCLHTLLENYNNPGVSELFEQELFSTNDMYILAETNAYQGDSPRIVNRDHEMIKNNFIISNISKILYDTKFNKLMDQFIEKLHNDNETEKALYFAESLNIARSLPENTKIKSKEIMDHLKNNGEECFGYLFSSFVVHEDRRVQSKFIDLIFHYFQRIQDLFFVPHNIDDVSSEQPTHFYANQQQELCTQGCSYLFDKEPKSKNTEEQLDERINFVQAFRVGVIDQQESYIWKFKDQQETSLEEINNILEFSQKFASRDFNERLSLTMQNIDNPVVDNFKQKLNKIKLNIC